MKRFKFSLQAVHDLREMRRDAAERELAKANAELVLAQKQVEDIRQRRASALACYAALQQTKDLDAVTIGSHNNYINSLMQLERQAQVRVIQVNQKLVARREAVTDAARESEATANLRE